MDGAPSISTHDLYGRLGTASAPLLFDVRRWVSFDADDRLIIGAIHRAAEDVEQWQEEIQPGRPVVAYCTHGHEVSQGSPQRWGAPAFRPPISRAAFRTGRSKACPRAGSMVGERTNGSRANIPRSIAS